jgi:DNA-binding winged helix-turn-helix (wHTH) protein
LIEQRPKVLDKADLHGRIWPDTYVVDANLNVLIAEIRRALEDSRHDANSSAPFMRSATHSAATPWS